MRRLLQVGADAARRCPLLSSSGCASCPAGRPTALLGDRRHRPERPAQCRPRARPTAPRAVRPVPGAGRSPATSATSLRDRRPRAATRSAGRCPATIELAFAALLIAVGLGVPLGYLAARYRGRPARPPRPSRHAGRRRRAGVLPRLPAQGGVRPPPGLVPAVRSARRWASTPPTSPASSCSTGSSPGECDASARRAAPPRAARARPGHHPAGGDRAHHPGVACSTCSTTTTCAPPRPRA